MRKKGFKILEIGAIQGISTIDYPKEVVSVLFLCGCPFRCPFCQNKSLVLKKDCYQLSFQEIIGKIKENELLLTGICITGGEPLMQVDGIIELIKEIHNLGLLIKIDTNGFYPNHLGQITRLVDFIAIDIKASPERYGEAIGRKKLKNTAISNLKKSLRILKNSSINYELRTTIVPGLNDSKKDIVAICELIKFYLKDKTYILQQFRTDGGTLHPYYEQVSSPSYKSLMKLKNIAEKYIKNVNIRGVKE